MAKPISSEKRADIIRHLESGKSKADVAVWLFVCVRTITRIWDKYTRLGSYEPEPQRSGRKALVSAETMSLVMAKIKEVPDMALFELIEEFNLPISQAALSKRLIKLGLAPPLLRLWMRLHPMTLKAGFSIAVMDYNKLKCYMTLGISHLAKTLRFCNWLIHQQEKEDQSWSNWNRSKSRGRL